MPDCGETSGPIGPDDAVTEIHQRSCGTYSGKIHRCAILDCCYQTVADQTFHDNADFRPDHMCCQELEKVAVPVAGTADV
ncbi:hypothetical protein ATCCBAA256_02550 [Mycobacterium montefiorense]|nr:hypothetical protein ATCCBAA256_02550 [Mycobacterium montefiorense]